MARCNIFSVLALSACLSVAFARIPSFGLMTAGGMRADLKDSDFRIKFDTLPATEGDTFSAKFATLATYPALGAQDVQSFIAQVMVKAGQSFPAHYHPRGTETLNALEGTFMISFQFEGLAPGRKVTNTIMAGESTVFPQGLIHEIKCISKTHCKFLSVLNSADPGAVGV